MDVVQALEDYFGCPVRIGASGNRLTLHRKDLDRLFDSSNEELLEILTPALDRTLEEQRRSGSLTDKVKGMNKRSLERGRPDIQSVSKELGMSDRTLQRRLAEEETSVVRDDQIHAAVLVQKLVQIEIIESLYPDEEMSFAEIEIDFMTNNLPQSEIQRFIKPAEIGRLAAFLSSPYASAFRGIPIRMDGGMVPTIF